jgi:4'-phosphopantetheinyl transferase EntD
MSDRRLFDLFPAEVAVETRDAHGPPPALWPEELALMARAVGERREEFARGRACARAALARLGFPAGPILINERRGPVWPEGAVGSITHCPGLVAAAVCRRGSIQGLGLDAEPLEPISPEVARLVCTPAEAERAADVLRLDASIAAKVLFSAKESVHKSIEPLTGETLDFLDVEVDLDARARSFVVRAAANLDSASPELRRIAGRFGISATHVLTAGLIERSAQG